MYLRHTTRRKNGKPHTYWRLVRSVREGTKVRQETVMTLGELDAEGRLEARALAARLGGRIPQRGLFDSAAPAEAIRICVDRVRVERGRSFGDVWLAWTLWRVLQMDALLESLLSRGREDVGWDRMAAILVMARLCEPSSKLHIAEDWYRTTALEDLLGIPDEKVNEDRVLRALDHLLPLKGEIEKHLRGRLGELFDVTYDLVLYDLTGTYFEGAAAGNSEAQRGHSPDHRPDCKQVCLALVVAREGMPLGYEVFAGNRVGVTTVEEVVSAMEARYGKADRVWVMDRGMVSEENLAWLRGQRRRYLVGTPRSELKRFAAALAEREGWRPVREGLEVKLCAAPPKKSTTGKAEEEKEAEEEDRYLLCRSAARQTKERAMHDRFSVRIVERLESLERRLAAATEREDRGKTERQVGRILGQNTRAAKKYKVHVVARPDRPSGLGVEWQEQTAWTAWAQLSEGAYLLRTNIRAMGPEDLWHAYVRLTDAEAAFRVHKSDLLLRPIWHHTAKRTRGHLLVCFLAYVLWKTLEQWQARAGLGNSPRTILGELKRIQSVDVVLPTEVGRDLRLRCIVRPDKAQADLLGRLGLDLPERLRVQEPPEM
jgi:transposase